MRPPGGLVAKLGDLDAAAGRHVSEVGQLPFDRLGQPRDDHEAGLPTLEPFDQGMIEKPFVGADNHRSDPDGDLLPARRQEIERPAGGMGVARPQLPMPEVLGLPLEAEQRVIRRAAPLDRVLADPRLLLLAVDDQDGRVDIEDEPERWLRVRRHTVKQAIVQGAHLWESPGSQAKKEPAQRGGFGIARQSREVLEDPILPQQLRCLDPFEPQDHRVQERQEHLSDAVPVVPLGESRRLRQQLPEPESAEEAMKQVRPAIVGQRR